MSKVDNFISRVQSSQVHKSYAIKNDIIQSREYSAAPWCKIFFLQVEGLTFSSNDIFIKDCSLNIKAEYY